MGSGSGFGISARAQTEVAPGVELGARVAAYDAPGGAGLGVAVSAVLGGDLELSGHLLSTPEASVASARLHLFSAALPTLDPNELHLDAEYAVAKWAGSDLQGSAFRAVGGVRSEPGSILASYQWTDAAFDRSDAHRSTLAFTAHLRLDEALRTDGTYPLELSLSYRDASEYAPGGAPAAEPGGALRRETTYRAALSGQVAGVSLVAEYLRTIEQDTAAGTAEHQSTWQSSASVA